MSKGMEEGYDLIESVAQNTHQWSSERGNIKKTPGKFDVDALTLISAKMEALTQKVDKLSQPKPVPANLLCEICGVSGHMASDCQLGMTSSSSSFSDVDMQQVEFNTPYRGQQQ